MHTYAAAGAGFLLAVLWFDLMFDVQTRKHAGDPLPPDVLASISAYYRRVTTDAYPMNCLVALVMLLTLAAICAEIVQGENEWWIGWGSLALAGSGFVPTMTRTVPNARRLGSGTGFGGRAVKARARGLPRSYAELCANGRGSLFAVDGAIAMPPGRSIALPSLLIVKSGTKQIMPLNRFAAGARSRAIAGPRGAGVSRALVRPAVAADAPGRMHQSACRRRRSAAPSDTAQGRSRIASSRLQDAVSDRCQRWWAHRHSKTDRCAGRAIASLRLCGSPSPTNVVTTSSGLPRPDSVPAQDTCALGAPQTDAHPRPPPAQVARTCARACASVGKSGRSGYCSSRYSRMASDCLRGGPSPSINVGKTISGLMDR